LSVALALIVLLGVLVAPLGHWSTAWRWSADELDAEDLAVGPQLAIG